MIVYHHWEGHLRGNFEVMEFIIISVVQVHAWGFSHPFSLSTSHSEHRHSLRSWCRLVRSVRICTYHVIISHEYCIIRQEYWGQPVVVKPRSYDIMYSDDVATWTVYLVDVQWRRNPHWFDLIHLVSLWLCPDHQTQHPKFQQLCYLFAHNFLTLI